MGVHLYKKTVVKDGLVTLSHVSAIRLSGADGLVAQYVQRHRDEDLEHWIISVEEICEITGNLADQAMLLFISPSETKGNPEVSLIKTLSGNTSIVETELLLMMQAIRSVEFPYGNDVCPSEIAYPEKQKEDSFFESLLIKGGNSNLKHTWKLMPPKMQIGGMIRGR